ncbi:nucleotidyl transferase AbiEii/AbiGii toxin family protein [Actinosynnema sp. NPDC020468]|uniref:nucleotidyl transferase AbiEii/AbiGii toxin family protein n=1 Tax=Actinosynnema sp. NPDC020468 TaxID=3154488 RepID=UPI00340CDD73
MFSGDFEIHLTCSEWNADRLAEFAGRNGLKFSHIRLDRGATPSQPMLTIPGSGTLDDLRALALRWRAELIASELRPVRTKIEAAPGNEGVPRSDDEADPELYFEHHAKVLLPAGDVRTLVALGDAVHGHGARASRNARRRREDGREERFVTQRCHGVGRPTARARLDDLLAALRDGGFEVLEVEEEYVVHDDALSLDRGWLTSWSGATGEREGRMRTAPAGEPGYPATYRPLVTAPDAGITQRATFDPALLHFRNAYRAGEPVFEDATEGHRWHAAREAAMAHLLAVVAGSPWAGNLVLRGSVVLRAWLGEAARAPGDLDFVVVPADFAFEGPEAKSMLDGLIAAAAATPGAGLRPEDVVSEHIWTYERVPGRRLLFPFDVEGLPSGTVQVDLVFNEKLPEPPIPVAVPPLGTSVLAASPSLSLAWKLQWLLTDLHPQGKDLYDATLLAEHTTVPLDLVRALLGPEYGARAADYTPEWFLSLKVDWPNFRDDHPTVTGEADDWLRRLALALDR